MNETQQIEVTIEELQQSIALADALTKLEKSGAFKKVILDGFFDNFLKSNAAALPRASANDASKVVVTNSIIGVGVLQDYFRAIIVKGADARKSLAEHEELQAELLAAQE